MCFNIDNSWLTIKEEKGYVYKIQQKWAHSSAGFFLSISPLCFSLINILNWITMKAKKLFFVHALYFIVKGMSVAKDGYTFIYTIRV